MEDDNTYLPPPPLPLIDVVGGATGIKLGQSQNNHDVSRKHDVTKHINDVMHDNEDLPPPPYELGRECSTSPVSEVSNSDLGSQQGNLPPPMVQLTPSYSKMDTMTTGDDSRPTRRRLCPPSSLPLKGQENSDNRVSISVLEKDLNYICSQMSESFDELDNDDTAAFLREVGDNNNESTIDICRNPVKVQYPVGSPIESPSEGRPPDSRKRGSVVVIYPCQSSPTDAKIPLNTNYSTLPRVKKHPGPNGPARPQNITFSIGNQPLKCSSGNTTPTGVSLLTPTGLRTPVYSSTDPLLPMGASTTSIPRHKRHSVADGSLPYGPYGGSLSSPTKKRYSGTSQEEPLLTDSARRLSQTSPTASVTFDMDSLKRRGSSPAADRQFVVDERSMTFPGRGYRQRSYDLSPKIAEMRQTVSYLGPLGEVDTITEQQGDTIQLNPSEADSKCGCGRWRPQWLQLLATPRFVTFYTLMLYLCCCVSITIQSGLLTTSSSRQALGHMESGAHPVFFTLGNLVAIPIILCARSVCRLPIQLFTGCLLLTLSALLSIIQSVGRPVFLPVEDTEKHPVNPLHLGSDQLLCNSTWSVIHSKSIRCQDTNLGIVIGFAVICSVRSFLLGVSNLTLLRAGIMVLQQYCNVYEFPIFTGMLLSMRYVGMLVAFLVTAIFADLHTKTGSLRDPSSEGWIHAWVFCEVIVAGFVFLLSFVAIIMPKIPSQSTALLVNLPLAQDDSSETDKVNSGRTVFRNLNLSTLFLCVGASLASVLYNFFLPSVPVIAKQRYHEVPWVADILPVLLYGTAASLGTLFGGYMTSRLTSRKCPSLFLVLTSVVCAVGVTAAIIITCDQSPLLQPSIASCSQKCQCSHDLFLPVCDGNGHVFLNPCDAGCTKTYYDVSRNFTGCSCSLASSVSESLCVGDYVTSCALGYAVLMGCMCLLAAVTAVPALHLALKDENKQKEQVKTNVIVTTFVCCQAVIGSLGGYGLQHVLDLSCVAWQPSCMHKEAVCVWYDVTSFSLVLHGIVAACLSMAAVLFTCAWLLSDDRPKCISISTPEKTTGKYSQMVTRPKKKKVPTATLR